MKGGSCSAKFTFQKDLPCVCESHSDKFAGFSPHGHPEPKRTNNGKFSEPWVILPGLTGLSPKSHKMNWLVFPLIVCAQATEVQALKILSSETLVHTK